MLVPKKYIMSVFVPSFSYLIKLSEDFVEKCEKIIQNLEQHFADFSSCSSTTIVAKYFIVVCGSSLW